MKNSLSVGLALSVFISTAFFASGCSKEASDAIDRSFDQSIAGPPVKSTGVVLNPEVTDTDEVEIQFRGPESGPETIVYGFETPEGGFGMTFFAEGAEEGEIRKFLSGSIQERGSRKLKILVGDRRVSCIRSESGSAKSAKGICVMRLVVYISPKLTVKISSVNGVTRELKAGETLKMDQ